MYQVFIWSEARKFSARITENLPQSVNTDTSRFYPDLPTVNRLVSRFREGLRLDPSDCKAVEKYIEQSKADNPGEFLIFFGVAMHTMTTNSICSLHCSQPVAL